MKYLDEFRSPKRVRAVLERIGERRRRPLRLMEFCGTHTHAIFRHGIRQLLPPGIAMLSGPGCPVCVTSAADLDRAIGLAGLPGVTLAIFGDMLRVPGSHGSLQAAKAAGADVRVVYSSLDALGIARAHPERTVILLGVGFETTAPTIAAAVLEAERDRLANFRLYCLHKLTPPAAIAILRSGEVALDGVLAPGHVSAIIGAEAWGFVPRDFSLPAAVAGFEPLDILLAIADLVEQHEAGQAAVHNAYGRGVRPAGNLVAVRLMEEVFQPVPAEWRGLGTVPASGLGLRPRFLAYDATPLLAEHGLDRLEAHEPAGCRCGDVLRGALSPEGCPLFCRACTPERPVGPCMVSSEGSCAASYRYGERP
ncbi:MAG TPA: hydrogenase formation protein HypD [Anaerolineae bacterium]|nr:hydrogenase formation protein HypD [Anaerolineae bacterium]HPL28648.1 hydrogenase formation protein HypD [Anaerolineae bacterium]